MRCVRSAIFWSNSSRSRIDVISWLISTRVETNCLASGLTTVVDGSGLILPAGLFDDLDSGTGSKPGGAGLKHLQRLCVSPDAAGGLDLNFRQEIRSHQPDVLDGCSGRAISRRCLHEIGPNP